MKTEIYTWYASEVDHPEELGWYAMRNTYEEGALESVECLDFGPFATREGALAAADRR